MATNKRKEAAALFELIDKSTLKVPKNAGALKIPSWWSSKSNPSTEAASSNGTSAAPAASAAPAINGQPPALNRTTAAPRPIARSTTTSSLPSPVADILPTTLPPSEAAEAETGQQHRLFDPPPANAAPPTPAATPSIRPPMPNLQPPVSPSVKSPPPPPAISPPVSAMTPIDTDEDLPEEATPAPAAARPFAPPTYAQGAPSRGGWTPPRASLARVPVWGLAAGVALIVIMVCLLIVMIMPKSPSQKAGNSGTAQSGTPGGAGIVARDRGQQSLIPSPQESRSVDPPLQRGNGTPPVTPDPVTAGGGSRAYAPGEVARSPDLYYVLIAQTPDRKIAERNAEFIAKNGVDVSLEVMPRGFFGLISVQGFRTLEEGEPIRAKIVQIGHLLPEYKRTKRAWDDATLQKFKRPTPAG